MDAIAKPSILLQSDPNGDAQFTIADLGLLLEQAFFLPGDWLIWTTATYAPPVAKFLEIGPRDYGGVLSGFASALAWLAALVAVCVLYAAVRDFDRALTTGVRRAYDDLLRRARVAGALLRYRVRRVQKKETQSAHVEFSEELELSANEMRALRLHADLEPGYALALSEVAAALELRKHEAGQLLNRLKRLNLVNNTIGGFQGESAYTLTAAGRAFLAFRRLTPRPS